MPVNQILADTVSHIAVLDYVWMGVPFRVPCFEVYAQIPDPIPDKYCKISQQMLPILTIDQYDVPLFDPLGLGVEEMPAYAIVLADFCETHYRMVARPADHIVGTATISTSQLPIQSVFGPNII